jgi:hypothetical protein
VYDHYDVEAKGQSSPNGKKSSPVEFHCSSSFFSEDVYVEVGKSVEEEDELAMCQLSAESNSGGQRRQSSSSS